MPSLWPILRGAHKAASLQHRWVRECRFESLPIRSPPAYQMSEANFIQSKTIANSPHRQNLNTRRQRNIIIQWYILKWHDKNLKYDSFNHFFLEFLTCTVLIFCSAAFPLCSSVLFLHSVAARCCLSDSNSLVPRLLLVNLNQYWQTSFHVLW